MATGTPHPSAALPGPLLSAVLIVRDEQDDITACLDSLAEVADEMIVYDTGSLDRTRELARAAGATVVEGFWDDDFGRARTDAAQAASGTWVLVLDADERLVADADSLRARLANGDPAEGFTVRIDNSGGPEGATGYASWGARLVRRKTTRWVGTVHERPVSPSNLDLVLVTMPTHMLTIEHLGYSEPQRVRRKAERNAALAQAELDAMATAGSVDQPEAVRTLVNLGRSLIGAGRQQDAVDTFEMVREISPAGSSAWVEATDHLARLLLGAGYDELVVVLSDQLLEVGTDPRYCAWLRAQALAQLGRPQEALGLIDGIDELIDPAGRVYDLAQVRQVRQLLEDLLRLERSN